MKTSKHFKQAKFLLCYGSKTARITKIISYRRLKKLFASEGYHLHRSGELVRGKLITKRSTPLDVVQGANIVHAIDSSCAGAYLINLYNTFDKVFHLGAGLYECHDGRGRKYHCTH